MPTSLWSYVYAIGAAQGVLLALALWRRPDAGRSYRILAGWIALLSVHLSIMTLYLNADPVPAPLLRAQGLTRFLPYLYAALFFVYARSITGGAPQPTRLVALHTLPFFLAMLVHIDFIMLPAADLEKLLVFGRVPPSIPPWRLIVLDVTLFSCALAYLGAAARTVWRYRARVAEERADADRQSLRWLTAMAGWQAAIWCVALLQAILHLPGINFWLIYGVVSAWILVLGFVSLNSPQPAPLVLPASSDTAHAPTVGEGEDERYGQVLSRIDGLMDDEQLYRKPSLSIAELAARCGYPEYLVSQAINRVRDANFYEFVNRWRVQAVQHAI
ncbi:MAG: hypothetical protein AAFX85_06335, partial [Pseudomonadota bacterium]